MAVARARGAHADIRCCAGRCGPGEAQWRARDRNEPGGEKVTGFAERRGDADAARVLYEDLTPKPDPSAAQPPGAGERDAGSGRPTKQERRAIDRLMGEE